MKATEEPSKLRGLVLLIFKVSQNQELLTFQGFCDENNRNNLINKMVKYLMGLTLKVICINLPVNKD